jgi:hypothetical protein
MSPKMLMSLVLPLIWDAWPTDGPTPLFRGRRSREMTALLRLGCVKIQNASGISR